MAARINGAKQPHLEKVKVFEKRYPYKLLNNEWKFKFGLSLKTPKTGKQSFYNPDYFCKKTGYYIEVATSKLNICEQGPRWRDALNRGLKLKIYWWEGEEITTTFDANENYE